MSTQTSPDATSVRRFVLFTDVVGILAVGLLLALTASGHLPLPDYEVNTQVAFWVIVALTFISQLAYVKVPHGREYEELAFFEVVVAAGMLLIAPVPLLGATLVGLLLAEVAIRREPLKLAYNMGNFATSTSVMIVTYHLLAGTNTPQSKESVGAMLVALTVFAAVNLGFQAELNHITNHAKRWDVIAAEWKLSAFMVVGGVAVGMTAVYLWLTAKPLLPFTLLPALAMWYAYSAAAQHVRAEERNRWLVTLGGLLAQHGQGAEVLDDSADAIRQIVNAPEAVVLQPHTGAGTDELRSRGILSSMWTDPGPRALTLNELPEGWHTGVVTRLDLGTANPGALLLGSRDRYRHSPFTGRTRGWSLEEADAPVLGALVAAVGSAMRAGAAFGALTEKTLTLTAVVDNTSDGIAMVDDSGQVRLWSQTMARMTGVEADQIASPMEKAPQIVQTLIRASRHPEKRSDGTPAPVRTRLTRADGEELEVTIATVRVREAAASTDSDTTGWVSILTVHDETRERRVERMKNDFVATISHELRTPITPIKGYARLLATSGDRMAPDKRTAALQIISDSSDRLARLVDDLLMASKVSGGTTLAIEMGIEDLDTLVRRVVSTFPQMSDRITVDLPAEPVEVRCDRDRAEQCLSNLLGNAEKYTPADSPIDIRAEVTGTQVHIHVRDRGPGIPVSDQARVFERFVRREDPFTMRTGGAGLGLHIARELAVAMGGGLTLQNPAAGPGAEFVLHLVTAEAPEVTVAQAAPPNRHPGASPATPPPLEGPIGAHSPAGDGSMEHPQDSRLAAM